MEATERERDPHGRWIKKAGSSSHDCNAAVLLPLSPGRAVAWKPLMHTGWSGEKRGLLTRASRVRVLHGPPIKVLRGSPVICYPPATLFARWGDL